MSAAAGDLLLSSVGLVLIILSIIVAAIWIFVPFAMFGTKRRLDRQTQVLESLALSSREQVDILRRIETLATIDAQQSDEREPEAEQKPFEPKPVKAEASQPQRVPPQRIQPEPAKGARAEPRIVPGRSRFGS